MDANHIRSVRRGLISLSAQSWCAGSTLERKGKRFCVRQSRMFSPGVALPSRRMTRTSTNPPGWQTTLLDLGFQPSHLLSKVHSRLPGRLLKAIGEKHAVGTIQVVVKVTPGQYPPLWALPQVCHSSATVGREGEQVGQNNFSKTKVLARLLYAGQCPGAAGLQGWVAGNGQETSGTVHDQQDMTRHARHDPFWVRMAVQLWSEPSAPH